MWSSVPTLRRGGRESIRKRNCWPGSTVSLRLVLAAVVAVLLSPAPAASTLAVTPDTDDLLDEVARWRVSPLESLQRTARHFSSMHAPQLVEVSLVGFSGDGNFGAVLDARVLQQHLLAAGAADDRQIPVSVLQNGVGRSLRLKHSLSFHVGHAPRSVAAEVNGLIERHVLDRHSALVPAEELEQILKRQYDRSSLAATIFVVNPSLLRNGTSSFARHGATAARLPQYWYKLQDGDASCPATFAAASNDRFVWLDVAAGGVEFGPRSTGDGLITAASLPRLVDPVKGTTLPDFVAKLSHFTRDTARRLLFPPMSRIPAPLESRVDVHVVEVYDKGSSPLGDHASSGRSTATEHHLDHFPWSKLEAGLSSVGAHTGQQVSVSWTRVPLFRCPACMLGLSNARRAQTSMLVSGAVSTTVVEYLDSVELVHWLRRADSGRFWSRFGDPDENDGVMVLPVILLNLDTTDSLMIDMHKQSVYVEGGGLHVGAVLAVQTQSGNRVTDWVCHGNARSVSSVSAERAVLASAIDAIWAVQSPHQVWDEDRSLVGLSYMWLAGRTPFGQLSSSTELPFWVKAASVRASLQVSIDELLRACHELVSSAVGMGSEFVLSLSQGELTALLRVLLALRLRLAQAITATTLFESANAQEHVEVAGALVAEARQSVYRVAVRLDSHLVCPG